MVPTGPPAKPGSNHRDFYIWSDTPDRFAGARVIFKDFEASNWSFDPVAGAYFWHRFYSHQPSLNYDNPAVRQAMFDVVDFWLAMGVDGLRLDAVPYLYAREATTCENLPETFAFLRRLRAHVDERFQDRMLSGRSEPVARRRRCLHGTGRHLPDGIPLPPHAADVHGSAPRRPLPDRRHPLGDPHDPTGVPVGPVSAQSRRADPRDGHATKNATTCTAPMPKTLKPA